MINFQDFVQENDFDIYDPVAFTQKLAQNQCISVATQNISSLSDISSPFLVLESLRTIASAEFPDFQDPI